MDGLYKLLYRIGIMGERHRDRVIHRSCMAFFCMNIAVFIALQLLNVVGQNLEFRQRCKYTVSQYRAEDVIIFASTGRAIYCKYDFPEYAGELLNSRTVCLCYNFRIILKCAASECSQNKNFSLLICSYRKHVNGTLYMIGEKFCIVHTGSAICKRCILIWGCTKIGSCNGNDIHLGPVLLGHPFRKIFVGFTDDNPFSINQGI